MKSKQNKILILLISFLILQVANITLGQNLISVSSTRLKSLNFIPSYRAGLSPNFLIDDTKWINYSVLVKQSDPTCSISVQIISGTIPDGVNIMVKAMPYVGSSRGKHGISIGKIKLSHVPQVLIDNIGTCYTGIGTRVGHQLIYTVDIKEFEQLKSGTPAINLLYTISQ